MDGSFIEEEITCALCVANDTEIVFPKGKAQQAQIVKCRSCELMYSSPRAQPPDHALYEGIEIEGLLSGVTTDINHPYRWRYDKESGQIRDFAATRTLLNKLYPSRGKIVEVGSSMGCLLAQFRTDGWDVLGIDPWGEVSVITREAHGFETMTATLDQAALPDESADVLIMLHVIEHVPDPLATLREIYRILKPGGHVVIETPRYDTLMFKMLQHRERSVKCDGHIYFFSFDTLRQAYEKVGFTEVETRAVGRTMSLERFLWNVGTVMGGTNGMRDKLAYFGKKSGLNNLKFTLNLRDMQRIVAQKPPQN